MYICCATHHDAMTNARATHICIHAYMACVLACALLLHMHAFIHLCFSSGAVLNHFLRHLRSAINVPLADIAGKSLMDVEKEYNMRFRQRRTNKVLVYDQDSTEASTSSATADFGALLKEDR